MQIYCVPSYEFKIVSFYFTKSIQRSEVENYCDTPTESVLMQKCWSNKIICADYGVYSIETSNSCKPFFKLTNLNIFCSIAKKIEKCHGEDFFSPIIQLLK